jgi:hypothetical protein
MGGTERGKALERAFRWQKMLNREVTDDVAAEVGPESGQTRGEGMSEMFRDLPSFLDLGAWTTQSILPLFNFFKDEHVAPALASLIFFAALALCALFLLKATYIRVQVRRRVRVVTRIRDEISLRKQCLMSSGPC